MIENQKLTCAENRQYHLLWDPIAGELWDKFGKRNWNEFNNKKTWLTLTIFCCSLQFIPTPPQALGEDIDVPFISCVPLSVQLGTAAIAPPGALIFTPNEPSVLWYKKWDQNSALKITISDVLNPEFPTYLSPVSFSFCGEFAPLQFKPLQPLQFRPPNVKQVRPAFTSSSQNLSTRFRTTYRLHFLLKSWYFCNQHVIFKWNQNKVWSPCKFLAVSKTHYD